MRYYITIWLLALTTAAQAQSPKYTLSFDTSLIQIGEQTAVTFTLTSNANDSVLLPLYKDSIISEIEVLSILKRDTSYSDDLTKRTESVTYRITSFDSGYHVVKPQWALVAKDTVFSEPKLFEVYTVPPKKGVELTDIKEIEMAENIILAWLRAYWHWLLIGLLLIALSIGLVVWYLKRPKEAPTVEKKIEPVVPAHKKALEELRRLKKEKPWVSGEFKEFHSELSQIVREYIEERFEVPAMELTTSEILSGVRLTEIEDTDLQRLKKLLTLSDLVKYAKEEPLNSENEQLLEYAIDWVKRTGKEPKPSEESSVNEEVTEE